MRIDVRGSDELKAVLSKIKSSDREVQSAIRSFSKSEMTKPWTDAIQSRARTRLQSAVIGATATVAVSNQNVRVQSAAKGRRLSGGLSPKDAGAPVEFGSNRFKQFGPRSRGGKVFYPAAKEMVPRLARLWVQTVVKTYADIFEGR